MSPDFDRSRVLVERLVQPGRAVREVYSDVDGRPNPNNRKTHIRAIVDGDVIVVRRWSRARGGWRYGVETRMHFELLADRNQLHRA